MNAVAELRRVVVDYPNRGHCVRALDHVDLVIQPGTTTAVLGRSGSGKSTLVAVLGLLLRPTAGSVILDGNDVTHLPSARLDKLRPHLVGIAFQSHHLDGALTAEENVMLPWVFTPNGRSRRTAAAHARALLSLLGIDELSRRRPGQMSGGQRQRVAVARAMFPGPPLLLADEPTGNLDEESAQEVAASLYALSKELGTAVVVVTHDSAVALDAQRQIHITRAVLDLQGTQ